MNKKPKVLILGGGLSGMLIAWKLEETRIPYVLLEARERLGGRIHSVNLDGGGTLDFGATWFADKHHHLLSLVRSLGIPYEKQFQGTKVLYEYHHSQRMVEEIRLPEQAEPSYVFSKGTSSLIAAIHSRLDPINIFLQEPATSLHLDSRQWIVKTNRRSFTTSFIVNTLPPDLFINTLKISPKVPKELQATSETTHTWMGESIKAGLTFDKSPWRDQKVGSMFSQIGPFMEWHDHIHQGSKAKILKGFIDPRFHHLSAAQRKSSVEKQLKLLFPQLQALSYHELDWQKEVYTFYPHPQSVFPHQNNGHEVLRKPYLEGRLYFAGTETADSYPGYLEGAVARAKEVGNILLASIQS